MCLDVNAGVPLCLDWLGGDRLAVGYHDGTVAIWALGLRKRSSGPVAPCYFHKIARAAVSALSWNLDQDLAERQYQLFYSSLDGTVGIIDLALPSLPTVLYITRDPLYAVRYSSFLAMPIYEQSGEVTVRVIDYRTSADRIITTALYPHWGRIRSIATSKFHPFCASAASDGTVRLTNVARTFPQKSSDADVVTLHRLDIGSSRLTTANSSDDEAELRMLENFAPTDTTIPKQFVEKKTVPTLGGWHPAIAWTAVGWNNNLTRSPLLASGSATGLVRIDWCLA